MILHQPEKCAVRNWPAGFGGFKLMKMSNGYFPGTPPVNWHKNGNPLSQQELCLHYYDGAPVKLVIFDRFFRLGNVSGKIRRHFHPGSSWNIEDPLLIPNPWLSVPYQLCALATFFRTRKRPRNLTKLEDSGISVPASQMQGLPSAARVMRTWSKQQWPTR